MKYADSRGILLDLLSGGSAMSAREMIRASGLNINQVENAIFRCWIGGFVLRTEKPLYEREKVNRGRRGRVEHTRPYHLYVISKGLESAKLEGVRYVAYDKKYLDPRGGSLGLGSKSGHIMDLLKSNPGEAFYSTVIASKLREFGVTPRDVMSNARRWEEALPSFQY